MRLQQSMMGEKMLSMSQQERAAFIQQQMSGLDGQLQKVCGMDSAQNATGCLRRFIKQHDTLNVMLLSG